MVDRKTMSLKWTPKTQKKLVPKLRKDNVSISISPTIDNASRITNVLKITNSLGFNLSNVPSSSTYLADYLTHPIHCNVHFGNDQFALILGYEDLVQGNITIKRVYYVEGLNYNLFSVGQFCDADLEVALRKSTCFIHLQQLHVLWQKLHQLKHGYGIKDFLKMIQRNLQAQVITIRTDRGIEFLNNTLHAYFKEEGIEHQTSTL
ncbi:retrovirus-related pol polyprotein from transposon TNT 1-94 [Tanacetum coccineum]